jgi:hypothetical protein
MIRDMVMELEEKMMEVSYMMENGKMVILINLNFIFNYLEYNFVNLFNLKYIIFLIILKLKII